MDDKNELVDTDELGKYDGLNIRLLKDETGIKVGDHWIRNCIY